MSAVVSAVMISSRLQRPPPSVLSQALLLLLICTPSPSSCLLSDLL